jgi:Polyketide cyclase / dehydrase and lipid transport
MRAPIFALVFFAAAAHAGPITAPHVSDANKAKLDKNEVVIKELKPSDGKGVAFEAMGVIDAPTTEVWPVLRDCSQFSKFMPRIKSSAIKIENGEPICHVELELPWPMTNLWSDTQSVYTEDNPRGHYSRVWVLLRGTYKRNDGSWTVVPWGADGKKTLVVYWVDSDPKMIIPDPIMRGAQTGALPDVFKAIRKRVVDVRPRSPPAPAPVAAPAPAAVAQRVEASDAGTDSSGAATR